MNELERIVAATREEVALRKRSRRPFLDALQRPGLSLIAEHKRRSPSAGPIREELELEDVVRAYERGGAAALSVLTEKQSFGGSLEDLGAARGAVSLPILRKDFIIDRYQVYESLAAADAILLIVAALPARELRALHELADEVGLAALVEVHDEHELEIALDIGARIIGINNRDLTTLAVDTQRALELRRSVPGGLTVVAESGYRTRADLEALAAEQFDAVLIGEALMRAGDIEAAVRELMR